MLMEGWLCGFTAMFITHAIYTFAARKKEEEEESNEYACTFLVSIYYNVLVIRIPILSVASKANKHQKESKN